MDYRWALHGLSGGNPNKQKTYLSPIPEILSQYFHSKGPYVPVLKDLLVETAMMDSFTDTKQNLNS